MKRQADEVRGNAPRTNAPRAKGSLGDPLLVDARTTTVREGDASGVAPYRPSSMRIDDQHCTECGMCTMVAPEIEHDPQVIPVNANTLEAMSQCPVGAIVWAEVES